MARTKRSFYGRRFADFPVTVTPVPIDSFTNSSVARFPRVLTSGSKQAYNHVVCTEMLLWLVAKLDDGKTVFYKDIGKDFLDAQGGLSGEIMPDYLHLSPKGYDIWGKAIKGDIEKLVK